MKTVIYYFTGTGNSLAVARKIAAVLEECELVPIASLMDTGEKIAPVAERVGIVCPVYFAGLPVIVASFSERLDLSRASYVFSVVTHGGGGGSAALRQIDGIMKTRSSQGLHAGYEVKMPGNYILMYEPPAGKKCEKILADADKQVATVAQDIRQGKKQDLKHSFVAGLIHTVMYTRFVSHRNDNDRKFFVTGACTSCGTCAGVCPAGNIRLVDGKPVWDHHCELCCGCIHLCPVQAIQAGRSTVKRQRYHNPSVSLLDMKGQRKKN